MTLLWTNKYSAKDGGRETSLGVTARLPVQEILKGKNSQFQIYSVET